MYILKRLRRREGISQSDLAKEIGVSLRTIQLYEKKDANIPIKNLTKIATYFDLSIAELYLHEVNDIGETYVKRRPFTKHGSVFYPLDHGKYLIMAPLVLMEQQKEYIEHLNEEIRNKNAFQSGFVVDVLEEETYSAFEVSGDSMNDESINAIPNKSIVLGVKINKEKFIKEDYSSINKPYILVCKNRILCKKVIGYDSEKNSIHCQNLNESPEYQDFHLSFTDVLEVFGIIKKQV